MVDKKIVFATFFPPAENVHLTKDNGMIPYILHREHGYESYFICYKNGDYPYLESETPGLKVIFMRRGVRRLFDGLFKKIEGRPVLELLANACRSVFTLMDALPILLKYGKKIDILQLYHLSSQSIFMAWVYRMVNRRGLLYLKLDMDPNIIERFKKNSSTIRKTSPWSFVSPTFDVISVESRELCSFIKTSMPYYMRYSDHIYYVPNGVDVKKIFTFAGGYLDKENLILHVGRIGNPQKASEVILEAFARVSPRFRDWKLVLIGPMEDYFKVKYAAFMEQHSEVRDSIRYVGFLKRRSELFEYYARAKILAIPSRFEGFSIASIEGSCFGDVILGSDLLSIRELTDGGKHGYICPVDDVECFSRALEYMMSHPDELRLMSDRARTFTLKNYNWIDICDNLDRIFREKMSSK